jgi:hypothetical protein
MMIGEKGFLLCAKDAVRELNKYVWLLREVTILPGKIVPLPNEIDSIERVATNQQSGRGMIDSLGGAWQWMQHSVASAYAVHDYFMWKLQVQTLRMVCAISLRYEKHGQTLFLENIPEGATQVHIEYYPLFNPDEEEELVPEESAEGESVPKPSKSWMFDEREITFLLGYTEGLAMMREGRILRKAANMEVTTDANELFQQGEKQCEELIKEICDQPAFLLAKS